MDTPAYCTKCGRPLADGASFCAFCGTRIQVQTDIVASNAVYEEYVDEDKDIERKARWEGNIPQSSTSPQGGPAQETEFATCHKCGGSIPAGSKFCPICQTQLFITCPHCGHQYSSKYSICSECGEKYQDALDNKVAEVKATLEEDEQDYQSFLKFLEDSQLKIIKGGTFQMGATPEQGASSFMSDRYPVHTVTVDTFIMAQYPVTQRLWSSVMGYNPSRFPGEDNPVENITINEVVDFLNAAREMFDMPFRLPTEAEWEYAARGGVYNRGYMYPGGNNLDELGWVKFNSGKHTHPVGLKKPNELDLYDMVGNVFEYVEDVYDSKFYSKSPQYNPCNQRERGNFAAWWLDSKAEYVVRGCSYYFDGKYATSSYRNYVFVGTRDDNLGFRLALDYPSDSFPGRD